MTKRKSLKLGDAVESIAKKTGIKKVVEIFLDGKDCGCDKRKEVLNEMFTKRTKVRCLTELEYNDYSEFIKNRTVEIFANNESKGAVQHVYIRYITKLYASVFEVPEYTVTHSNKPLIKMITKLDKVFNAYN